MVGNLIPVTYRVPNSFLGYDEAGEPRLEARLACRVRVLSCRLGQWEEVTPDDAVAEGFRNEAAWRSAYADLSGPCWITRFQVEREDRVRLLSARVVAGRTGAYVEAPARALPDEPEAVSDDWLRQFSQEARDKEWDRERTRRESLGELTFDEQVASLAAEARRRHIDVRAELRAIRRWRDPRVCEKQLQTIRRKLHPDQVAA